METVTLKREHVRGGNQDPAELAQFLALVKSLNVRRYLEIGCRNGDTFDAVMRTIGPGGGFGLAIDIPENADAKAKLRGTVNDLNRDGMRCEVIFGNSQVSIVRQRAASYGPFDLILIDADHTYQGVKKDFEAYGNMAPIVALHDVAAPRGHMSDGKPNDVGVFWNEIKGRFKYDEFVTPGANMGFGVLFGEINKPKAQGAHKLPPLYIACPAWGQYYVDIACRFTIPAVLRSLEQSPFSDVTFVIHTDDRDSFKKAVDGRKIHFMPLNVPMRSRNQPMARLPDSFWVAFKQAHKDAINITPRGGLVTLLNSDVVISRECFSYVADKITSGKKVVASVGIRTQIEDNDGPPVGATSDELFQWIWGHRHHITEECIWDHGRSQHPTILFFEDGGNVAMHCFHLTPMFLLRDRNLYFKGTIDDDLLLAYRDDDVDYISGGEVAFAEISPNWKTHPFDKPLSVESVLDFWRKRTVRPHYLRNFKQRMRVLGNPTQNHPAADAIIAGLGR